jgi:hypothetical protein
MAIAHAGATRPVLDIAGSSTNRTLSWMVPSTKFVLQQNTEATSTNWTDVTNVPVLNLTTLRNEVILPAFAGSRFYRLKH